MTTSCGFSILPRDPPDELPLDHEDVLCELADMFNDARTYVAWRRESGWHADDYTLHAMMVCGLLSNRMVDAQASLRADAEAEFNEAMRETARQRVLDRYADDAAEAMAA